MGNYRITIGGFMRILLIALEQESSYAIQKAFEECGQEVDIFFFQKAVDLHRFVVLDLENRTALATVLQKQDFDLVFSIGYLHEASVFCHMLGCLYVSWILNLPNFDLFRNSVSYSENYFFAGESALVDWLKKSGAQNVFYLPAAAAFCEKIESSKIYEISFIGKIPVWNRGEIFSEETKLSRSCLGYLDGFVHSQRVLYGWDLFSDPLPLAVLEEIMHYYPIEAPADIYVPFSFLCSQYYLMPQVIQQERLILFQGLKNLLTVFTGQREEENISYVVQPYPKGLEERKRIIASSKINLNITNRYFINGIPSHAFEIMGYGGFLITNYQKEFFDFFEVGKEWIYFENANDLLLKTVFYCNHPEARGEISERALEKVKKKHLYVHRAERILELLD